MDEDALNTSVRKFHEAIPCPLPGRYTFRRISGSYSIRDANKRVAAVVYFLEGSRATSSSRPLSAGEASQGAKAICLVPDLGLI
jgi:hypothetical protein